MIRRAPRALGPIAAAALAAAALAPGAATAAARPAYGGELRIALPLPARVDDPALAVQPQDLVLARALHATPLVLGPDGRLAPGLLAEVPAAQPGERTFRLLLRPGLRFADATPLAAGDLATSLARLLRPEVASPHAWVALAIQGAEAVLEGRASSLSGVQVLSDHELLVTLAFPFPQFPAALAALPAAVVSAAGAGAGPFRPESRESRESRERLVANPFHWRGRSLGDALVLSWPDPRAAARGLETGALELSLRPEPAPGAVLLPVLTATYAAVNGRRLGEGAAAVRLALAGLDRTELARRFVRSPAAPLERLLPAAILPPAAQPDPPARPAAAAGAPARLVVLVPGWLADPRAVAERLQVKLFDGGLRAALEPLDQVRYAARLAAGDWDLAVVAVPLLTTQPALAAGQVALAVAGPGAARRAEQALAALDGEALGPALEALRAELDLWPLYAAGGRAAAGPGLHGLELRPDGGFDAGDLWRAGAPR